MKPLMALLLVSAAVASSIAPSPVPILIANSSVDSGKMTIVLHGDNALKYRAETERQKKQAEHCSENYEDKLDEAQLHGLRIVTLLSAFLSWLGASFIIGSYVRFGSLRSFAFKLIMLLSLSDWFASLHFLVGTYHNVSAEWRHHHCPSSVCIATAAVYQFAQVASFLWTSCIAFNIYAALKGYGELDSYERYYHLVSWGTSGVLLLCAMATGSLGYAGNWCWIRHDHHLARFLFFFLPLLCVMSYNSVMYIRVGHLVRQLPIQYTVNSRIRQYLAVFLFLNTFSLLNRMHNYIDPSRPSLALYFLDCFFSPLQGFGNALVYGLNRKVMAEYKSNYPAVYTCCNGCHACCCSPTTGACACCSALGSQALDSLAKKSEQQYALVTSDSDDFVPGGQAEDDMSTELVAGQQRLHLPREETSNTNQRGGVV